MRRVRKACSAKMRAPPAGWRSERDFISDSRFCGVEVFSGMKIHSAPPRIDSLGAWGVSFERVTWSQVEAGSEGIESRFFFRVSSAVTDMVSSMLLLSRGQ